ncbi:alpha/beta hydrolase [Actinomycetes bacterium M1A6_2h]
MPFFDGARGRVHYRTWNAPEPRADLVFLHGRGQHSGNYHRFAGLLAARGISTWALDHYSHGLSEGDAEGLDADPLVTLDGLVSDAAQLTSLVKSERPLALMGHSLGTATAIPLLVRLPEAFASAIFCALPPRLVDADTLGAADATGVPVLVVHGVDDRMVPVDPVRSLVAERTRAKFVAYDDAGHDLLHEKVHSTVTGDVADHILRFA